MLCTAQIINVRVFVIGCRVSPKTLLTYCTTGVLLRTLIGGDNALATVTHVVVVCIHMF